MGVYLTGDKHAEFKLMVRKAIDMGLTKDDVLVILGDAGLNYYLNHRDIEAKRFIEKHLPCDLAVVRGNHEYRPEDVFNTPYHDHYSDLTLVRKAHFETFLGNEVLVEDQFPKIKYLRDGCIYDIEGMKTLVIGGAYSVDKYYRLAKGWTWVENEQLSKTEMRRIMSIFRSNHIDAILSHTAPAVFEPCFNHLFMDPHAILGGPESIEKGMERWMDELYLCGDNDIQHHYWGHFHGDVQCGSIGTMLYHRIIPFGERL